MLKAYSISTVATGAGTLASVGTNIVLARLMGPAQYGTVGLTLTLILALLVIGCLGLNEVGARYIARFIGEEAYRDCRSVSLTALSILGVSSLLLTVLTLYIAPHIGNWMTSDGIGLGLLYFAPFIPILAAFQWAAMVLKGIGHNTKQLVFENCILQIAIFTFSIFAWVQTADPYYVLIAHGFAYLFTGILLAIAAIRALIALPSDTRKPGITWKELLGQGLPVSIIGVANRVQRRGDSIIIGAILGDTAVGLYRAAYTLASSTKPLRKVTRTFAIHYLSRSYGMRRADLLRSHYDIGVRAGLALTLPVAFMTIGLAEELVALLFGPEYSGAVLIVQILAVGQIALVTGGPAQALFGALKENWLRMQISIAAALITLLLQIVLINMFGLRGIAIATSSGFAILLLTLVWFARNRFEEFSFPEASGLSSAIACLSGGFLLALTPLPSAIALAIGFLGALILFVKEIKAVNKSILTLQ